MYFLHHIYDQYSKINILFFDAAETPGGAERPEAKPEVPEMTPTRARELAEDSGRTAKKMGERSAELGAAADELTGGTGSDVIDGDDGSDVFVGDSGDDTLQSEAEAARREAIITQMEAAGDFIGIEDDEAAREALIEAKLTEESEGAESSETLSITEQAEEIAKELGFDDFLAETDEDMITLLEGLEFDGTESPEEREALIQEYLEALQAQRFAELQRIQTEIDAELSNPIVAPERRTELNNRRSAVNSMMNSYGEGRQNGSYGDFHTGGIGEKPTAEFIEKYGETGYELAAWLQTNGYPDNGVPNNCGRNCGEALNGFGMQGLPTSGRHGYRWAEICEQRSPSQFKKIDTTPQEAPAGAIISYNKGTGGSAARGEYGHVEIALGNNKGYYFGKVASAPGGSNKNFAAGTYEIYMPISKTA